MLIKRRKPWELKDLTATDENVFINRRAFVAAAGGVGAIALTPGPADAFFSVFGRGEPPLTVKNDPTRDLYPAKRNPKYTIERDVTPAKVSAKYNNFYEFGSHKQIYTEAQKLKTRPWEVRIDGMVEKPMTIGIDDLIRKLTIEERLYRHRCVEAWSMTIPWSGFPLAALVAMAKPTSAAKYVRFATFHDPEVAPGQRQTWYPWPFSEGITIEEATNEMAFMVTGAYGKPLAKQFGAPLRLALPWKFGFKSIKSIDRISFLTERPVSFWEEIQPSEYGFWANVNPNVSHPRWSQARERVLGTSERVPTRLFNGYAEQVAHLYPDADNPELYR